MMKFLFIQFVGVLLLHFILLAKTLKYFQYYNKIRFQSRATSLTTTLAAVVRHRRFSLEARALIKESEYEICTEDYNEKVAIPRLNPDIKKLFQWIERYSGSVDDIQILKSNHGWSLITTNFIPSNEVIMNIPKLLCIYSNPEEMEVPFLENTQLLMESLHEDQWRARLAIALLSERTKVGSFYTSYLMNLPWEFNGMPIFYKAEEVEALYDYELIQNTRKRCQFLGEYTRKVLKPLHTSALDPFAGNIPDINAFGWGFAAASSRAFHNSRNDFLKTSSAVLIPLIDMIQHHFHPSCEIIETKDSFQLITKRDIEQNEELSINYGSLSTDEFLADYGFTCDNNPHDTLKIHVDELLINTARKIMGQSNFTISKELISDGKNIKLISDSYTFHEQQQQQHSDPLQYQPDPLEYLSDPLRYRPDPLQYQPIGRESDVYSTDILSQWQRMWLNCLNLYGNNSNNIMYLYSSLTTSTSSTSTELINKKQLKIDGRLLAMLRILYSTSEEELLKNGYNPFLLQEKGSLIKIIHEMHVVRTLIGIVIIFYNYHTNISEDLLLLKNNINEINNLSSLKKFRIKKLNYNSLNEFNELILIYQKILRDIYKNIQNIKQKHLKNNEIEIFNEVYNLNQMGIDTLSTNMREIYKYRIRKKHMLINLIQTLNMIHEKLIEEVVKITKSRERDEIINIYYHVFGLIKDSKFLTIEEQDLIKNDFQSQKRNELKNELLDIARDISKEWTTNEINL